MSDSSREQDYFISIERIITSEVESALFQLDGKSSTRSDVIPLTFRFWDHQLTYRSAIALSIAGKQPNLAQNRAKQLIDCLKEQISSDFAEIELISPAWIQFHLREAAIQGWLQGWVNRLTTVCFPSELETELNSISLSRYVRDRCCTIWELGSEENIISHNRQWNDLSNFSLNILAAKDWEFMYQLIATTDALEKVSPSQELEKSANRLSKEFLEFHRHCQIFDRKQPNFPDIAIIRLLLIAITEAILKEVDHVRIRSEIAI